MRELHLFAGAGGGILAGQLLGHRCVCAVEWEPYAQAALIARQNDGTFPAFPIWPDVQTFDGRPWRNIVDVVAGGFPCQDISVAGGVQALTESAAACGTTWPASLAKYDPASHTLKTAQLSLLEDLTGCSVTLPASGLMRNGECWELPTLEPRTSATEFGCWVTPSASDATRGGTITDNMTGRSLVQMVNTPCKWPTATATAYKGWSPNHNRSSTDDRLDYTVERQGFAPGQQTPPMRLNPDWVEWLMGWPIGHTALKPLETGKYQEWQQQHSIY